MIGGKSKYCNSTVKIRNLKSFQPNVRASIHIFWIPSSLVLHFQSFCCLDLNQVNAEGVHNRTQGVRTRASKRWEGTNRINARGTIQMAAMSTNGQGIENLPAVE